MKRFIAIVVTGLLAGIWLGAASAPATAPATTRAALAPIDKAVLRNAQGNWMIRHNNFVAKARAGNIDLYLEGDSITDLFATTGKAVYQKEFGGWKTADFGISGDTCQNVIWRLENGELDDVKPKVVMLMIGTNNSGSYSGEEIARGVTKIVDIFKEKLPETKILLLAIFPRGAGPEDPNRVRNEAANKIIAKLDGGNVKYLNINDKFLDADGKLLAGTFSANDKLHPTAKGYQIWADAVKPQLTEWLGPPAATAAATTAH